jgi:hypothetical protein
MNTVSAAARAAINRQNAARSTGCHGRRQAPSATGEAVCSFRMLLMVSTKSQNLDVVCFRPSRDSDENISCRTLRDNSN